MPWHRNLSQCRVYGPQPHMRRQTSWWRRPHWIAVAGSVAIAAVLSILVIRLPNTQPQPPMMFANLALGWPAEAPFDPGALKAWGPQRTPASKGNARLRQEHGNPRGGRRRSICSLARGHGHRPDRRWMGKRGICLRRRLASDELPRDCGSGPESGGHGQAGYGRSDHSPHRRWPGPAAEPAEGHRVPG